MDLFKKAQEAAAAQSRQAQRKIAEARERLSEKAFARSPIGLATAAHERGDALLQVALRVDGDSSAILHRIEKIGWKLEHVACAYLVKGDSDNIYGELTGVYLFRPADSPPGSDTEHTRHAAFPTALGRD